MIKKLILGALVTFASTPATAATYLFTINGVVTNGLEGDTRNNPGGTPWRNGERFEISVLLDLGSGSSNVSTPLPGFAVVPAGATPHQATISVGSDTIFSADRGAFEITRELGTDYLFYQPGGFSGYQVDIPGDFISGFISLNIPIPASVVQSGDVFSPFSYTSRPNEVSSVSFGINAPNAFRPDIREFRTMAYDSTKGDFTVQATVIEPLAVPEPSTWAFAIVGFGLAGAAMRRSRGRVSAALA